MAMPDSEVARIIKMEIPLRPKTVYGKLKREAMQRAYEIVMEKAESEGTKETCYDCRYEKSCVHHKNGEWMGCRQFKAK